MYTIISERYNRWKKNPIDPPIHRFVIIACSGSLVEIGPMVGFRTRHRSAYDAYQPHAKADVNLAGAVCLWCRREHAQRAHKRFLKQTMRHMFYPRMCVPEPNIESECSQDWKSEFCEGESAYRFAACQDKMLGRPRMAQTKFGESRG